jgi:hypothetical protein
MARYTVVDGSGRAPCVILLMPAWPNGQGIRLRIGGLRVRLPSWVDDRSIGERTVPVCADRAGLDFYKPNARAALPPPSPRGHLQPGRFSRVHAVPHEAAGAHAGCVQPQLTPRGARETARENPHARSGRGGTRAQQPGVGWRRHCTHTSSECSHASLHLRIAGLR